MSLDVRELTVTTATGTTLLDRCSWSVQSGGRLGIIGESGSGKSLTALAVLGLLPAGMSVSGSVTLDGEELLGRPEKWLRTVRGRRVAMVFQEPLTALDPLMTVGRQIAGPLRLHDLARPAQRADRVRELLREVALTDTDRILGSYPWQLSGGQRQRVSLAMALACEPRVLIADEPTTALDVTVQAEILALLDGLIARTGITLVFISHDLPVISQVAEQLVVMRHGRVVEAAGLAQALHTPQDPYTRQLIESARRVTELPQAGGER